MFSNELNDFYFFFLLEKICSRYKIIIISDENKMPSIKYFHKLPILSSVQSKSNCEPPNKTAKKANLINSDEYVSNDILATSIFRFVKLIICPKTDNEYHE